jgi:hypothetical protein
VFARRGPGQKVSRPQRLHEPITLDPSEMSPKKQRGGAAEWTTDEQKLWLMSQKSAHTAARTHGGKKFSLFWANVFEGWIGQWPNEPPTVEETEKGVDAAHKMKNMKKVSKLRCIL